MDSNDGFLNWLSPFDVKGPSGKKDSGGTKDDPWARFLDHTHESDFLSWFHPDTPGHSPSTPIHGELKADGVVFHPPLEPSPLPEPLPPPPATLAPPPSIARFPQAPIPSSSQAWIASLGTLILDICTELQIKSHELLNLNKSRIDALLFYLDQLAGIYPGSDSLSRWIHGPRNLNQEKALKIYFEEIALLYVGQVLLLKAWSEQGMRKLQEPDLGKMNWTLNAFLKPHVPFDREIWQIAQKNIYSWFTPSPRLQKKVFDEISRISVRGLSSQALIESLARARTSLRSAEENTAFRGFDSSFIQAAWNHLSRLGFESIDSKSPFPRRKTVFTPSLRDGRILRLCPWDLEWIAMERHLFLLLVAEMAELFPGPRPPFLWCEGSGLEVQHRDQLDFNFGSLKSSVLNKVKEIESCDLAFVLEESCIRSHQKSVHSQHLRSLIEEDPYFKNFKGSEVSLGDLQACVALSKLRPGGLLVWLREEPLSQREGQEHARFFLDRTILLEVFDFSQVEGSFPPHAATLPKFAYFFRRELDAEKRKSHFPKTIRVKGLLKSHLEVGAVIETCFAFSAQPEEGNPALFEKMGWRIAIQKNPTPQGEWSHQWPDSETLARSQRMENFKERSIVLGQILSIRTFSTKGVDGPENGGLLQDPLYPFDPFSSTPTVGLYLSAGSAGGERVLSISTRPEHNALLLVVPQQEWIPPLIYYLRSALVRDWLEHSSEQRHGKWLLKEQNVKMIPIPKKLWASIQRWSHEPIDPAFLSDPQIVLEKIVEFNQTQIDKPVDWEEFYTRFFVKTSLALFQLEELAKRQKKDLWLRENQQIRWIEFIKALPPDRKTPFTRHPQVKLVGTLPAHVPILKMDVVKFPAAGILLLTENGTSLNILIQHGMLREVLFDQFIEFENPTWSELVQWVQLPLDIAEASKHAEVYLLNHGQEMVKIKTLWEILGTCQRF